MARPLLPLIPAACGLWVGVAVVSGVPLTWLALPHVLVALGTWLFWRRERKLGKLLPVRAGAIAFALPIFGALAAWLIHPPNKKHGDLAEDYRAFIAYDQVDRERAGVLDTEEALRRELSVTPLVEVLRTGDLAAKQAAAATLAGTMGAAGVAVLREALTAPNDETRLFASLALVRAEEQRTAELADARNALAITGPTPAARLAVATAARRYAESSLPVGNACDELWREVAEQASHIVAEPADRTERIAAWHLLAAARRGLDDHRGALLAAREAMMLAPSDPEVLTNLAEMLFEAGDLDSLQALAPSLVSHLDPASPYAAAANYWLKTSAGASA